MNISTKAHLETINQQLKELIGVYRKEVSLSGVSENEFWVWYTLLIMDGEHTQQEICSAWSMTKQTVNSIITNMVQKGYITLEMIPGTRNRKRICLTDPGRAYGERLVYPIFDAELRAFCRLSEDEVLLWQSIVCKYITMLKEEIHGSKNDER